MTIPKHFFFFSIRALGNARNETQVERRVTELQLHLELATSDNDENEEEEENDGNDMMKRMEVEEREEEEATQPQGRELDDLLNTTTSPSDFSIPSSSANHRVTHQKNNINNKNKETPIIAPNFWEVNEEDLKAFDKRMTLPTGGEDRQEVGQKRGLKKKSGGIIKKRKVSDDESDDLKAQDNNNIDDEETFFQEEEKHNLIVSQRKTALFDSDNE
jgi:hypothetical protein